MQEKNFKKAIEDIRAIKLTSSEKADMALHILATDSIPSPFDARTFRRWFIYSPVRSIMTVALILVISGGGVAAASDRAIPGETLYAMKTKIFEPLRDVFLTTPVAKAKWQAEKVDRRLNEAEALATQGQLTASTSAQINDLLQEHTSAFDNALALVRNEHSRDATTTADSLSERFREGLHTHAVTLEKIANSDDASSTDHVESKKIADNARTIAESVGQVRVSAVAAVRVMNDPAIENKSATTSAVQNPNLPNTGVNKAKVNSKTNATSTKVRNNIIRGDDGLERNED